MIVIFPIVQITFTGKNGDQLVNFSAGPKKDDLILISCVQFPEHETQKVSKLKLNQNLHFFLISIGKQDWIGDEEPTVFNIFG